MLAKNKALHHCIFVLISIIIYVALGYAIGHFIEVYSVDNKSLYESDSIEEIEYLGSSDKEIFLMISKCREELIYLSQIRLDSSLFEEVISSSNKLLALQDDFYANEEIDYNSVIAEVDEVNSLIRRTNSLLEDTAKERQSIVKINKNRESNYLSLEYIGIDKSQLKNYAGSCATLFGFLGMVFSLFICLLIQRKANK